ncbi:MAG TPA: hypothetical protein PKY82_32860 [Pyrinomonadaceae bacterium]|nr:hypothetical protein [Pyrinomonadaceae bacterium]
MHCPSCGQQQVSAEIKFCSRCGFPLGLVSEILAHGGFLPQLADLHKTKTRFTKKNGVIFSLFWFMFFLLIMAPFWGILGVEKMAGISAITGIFGGLMWLIGSLALLKSSRELYPNNQMQMNQMPINQPQNLYGASQYQALPPQQSVPISAYAPPKPGSWRETNDLVQPGTVTDETTKMLHNKETGYQK